MFLIVLLDLLASQSTKCTNWGYILHNDPNPDDGGRVYHRTMRKRLILSSRKNLTLLIQNTNRGMMRTILDFLIKKLRVDKTLNSYFVCLILSICNAAMQNTLSTLLYKSYIVV